MINVKKMNKNKMLDRIAEIASQGKLPNLPDDILMYLACRRASKIHKKLKGRPSNRWKKEAVIEIERLRDKGMTLTEAIKEITDRVNANNKRNEFTISLTTYHRWKRAINK